MQGRRLYLRAAIQVSATLAKVVVLPLRFVVAVDGSNNRWLLGLDSCDFDLKSALEVGVLVAGAPKLDVGPDGRLGDVQAPVAPVRGPEDHLAVGLVSLLVRVLKAAGTLIGVGGKRRRDEVG